MSEAHRYKAAADKYNDNMIKLYRENPELSFSKLALKFKKIYNIDKEPDYLRKVMAYVVNNNVREKINQKDINLLDDDVIDLNLKSYYQERPDFNLPKYNNNILILNDIHIPYHDEYALRTAIKYGKERQVNTIILNGDIADFYSMSDFSRNPNQRDLKFELEIVRRFLEQLRKIFPNADIYYKYGNHEYRYERYLINKAPELFNVDEIQLSQLFKLHTYDIKPIDYFTVINAGKLPILHGHEIKSGGINIARSNLLKAMNNVAAAHNHTTQEIIKQRLGGSVIGSWSIGCLCGLKPDYAPINNWNHGFAYDEIEDSGDFDFHNLKIVKGVVK